MRVEDGGQDGGRLVGGRVGRVEEAKGDADAEGGGPVELGDELADVVVFAVGQDDDAGDVGGRVGRVLGRFVDGEFEAAGDVGAAGGVDALEVGAGGGAERVDEAGGVVKVDDGDAVGGDEGVDERLAGADAEVLGIGRCHGAGAVDDDADFAAAVGGDGPRAWQALGGDEGEGQHGVGGYVGEIHDEGMSLR